MICLNTIAIRVLALSVLLIGGSRLYAQQKYFIMNQNSGRVLDVTGGSVPQAFQNGTAIQQWDWLGGANQQWMIVPLGNGYNEIVNVQSGKVLDVRDLSLNPYAVIQQWDWLGGANQQWMLVDNGDGTNKIKNLNSSLVLDVDGERSTNGASVLQEYDLTSKYEQPSINWLLIPVDDSGQNSFFPTEASNDATYQALKNACSGQAPSPFPIFRSWPCGANVNVYMSGFKKNSPLLKAIDNWNQGIDKQFGFCQFL